MSQVEVQKFSAREIVLYPILKMVALPVTATVIENTY